MSAVWVFFILAGSVITIANLVLFFRLGRILGLFGALSGCVPVAVGLWQLGVFE